MNTITSFYENQLKAEADITRKMLKIVPDDQYDWKPHQKSMSVRQLATHIAELPSWIPLGINTEVLDFAAGDYKPTPIDNQKQALESLSKTSDEFLQNPWTMRNGEEIYFTISKEELIRVAISQTIHHRAQMGVFLRLLNIPIPGSYGPSADEMGLQA